MEAGRLGKIRDDSANPGEKQGIIVQCEMTLQRMAMVEIAKTLWDKNWIKEKLIQVFIECEEGGELNWFEDNSIHNGRCGLIAMVLTSCKSLCESTGLTHFPHLEEKLQFIIEVMGVQINDWLRNVFAKLRKFSYEYHQQAIPAYLSNIIWTNIGTIDYAKSVRKMIDEKKLPNNYMEFCEVCFNCFEDDIENWFKKESEISSIYEFAESHCRHLQSDTIYAIRDESEYNFHLLLYWKYRREKGDSNMNMMGFMVDCLHSNDPEKIYHMDESVDANMLFLCAFNRYYPGVEYFWSRMDKESQTRNINEATKALFKARSADMYGGKFQIAAFLMHRMLPENWHGIFGFLREDVIPGFCIITMLTWPWADLTFPSLEELIDDVPDSIVRFFCFEVMVHIFEIMCDEYELPCRKKICRHLAFYILERHADEMRQLLEIRLFSLPATIDRLIETNDFVMMKAYINHPVMKDIKASLIKAAAWRYSYALEKKDRELIDGMEIFKSQVLCNDKERKEFTGKLIIMDD